MTGRAAAIDLAVLREVTRAADAGEPCPSNNGLTDLIGAQSPSSPVNALRRLERAGLIRVERFATARRVTIVATGRQTRLDAPAKPHWRERPEHAAAAGGIGQQMAALIRTTASERGVTLRSLCADAGTSESTVTNLERATRPHPQTVARFLPFLGDRLRAILPPHLLPEMYPPEPEASASPGPISEEPPTEATEPPQVRPTAPNVGTPDVPSSCIPPRPKGRPRTFEEQLAAVAAGAGLVTVPRLRRADPDITLGGVGSGML